jgi:predicted TIM-barrel fold metal-dependent hydrolase
VNVKPVDIHTHFFGPRFFELMAGAARSDGDPEPGLARLEAAGIEVPRGSPVEHARRWVAEMDRNGVDRMVTFASHPGEVDSVVEGAAASEGRLVLFALMDPTAAGAPPRVGELAGRGARGLVLFPAMHRFDPSDPALEPFFRAAEESGLTLLVHLGVLRVRIRDLLGMTGDFDLRFATPARLRGALDRYPGVRFVVPHFGGGYFEEVLELGRAFPHLALDTSSSNSWIRLQPGNLTLERVLERALEAFGPERIHFGTDSSVFPRGWRSEVYAKQTAALDAIGVSETDRERILRGNTLALLAERSGAGGG